MEPVMRLFFALQVPDAVRAELVAFSQTLAQPWRPVTVEKMHITLAFMPEIAESRLAEIIDFGKITALEVAAFSVSLAECGCFPERGNPTVFYVKIDGGAGFMKLAEGLRCRLGRLADQKEVKPHLTLARCRSGRAEKSEHRFTGNWGVSSFCLIKSDLTAEGARYQVLHEFSLG